jgi:hypothetical protein
MGSFSLIDPIKVYLRLNQSHYKHSGSSAPILGRLLIGRKLNIKNYNAKNSLGCFGDKHFFIHFEKML